MKTQNTKSTAAAENVIDATEVLKSKRTGRDSGLGTRLPAAVSQSRVAPRAPKILKKAVLDKEEAAVLDRYIAARRREQSAAAAAEALKSAVLQIVKVHQQVARRGALVSLDHSYRWHYSGTITVLAKSLSEEREKERENGTAKATVSATVAFEDVRRKDRSRREGMEGAA